MKDEGGVGAGIATSEDRETEELQPRNSTPTPHAPSSMLNAPQSTLLQARLRHPFAKRATDPSAFGPCLLNSAFFPNRLSALIITYPRQSRIQKLAEISVNKLLKNPEQKHTSLSASFQRHSAVQKSKAQAPTQRFAPFSGSQCSADLRPILLEIHQAS
jgi:hypothetical protein